MHHISWLVVWPPMKNMKVNWDDYQPNRWENKIDVPNHQPVIHRKRLCPNILASSRCSQALAAELTLMTLGCNLLSCGTRVVQMAGSIFWGFSVIIWSAGIALFMMLTGVSLYDISIYIYKYIYKYIYIYTVYIFRKKQEYKSGDQSFKSSQADGWDWRRRKKNKTHPIRSTIYQYPEPINNMRVYRRHGSQDSKSIPATVHLNFMTPLGSHGYHGNSFYHNAWDFLLFVLPLRPLQVALQIGCCQATTEPSSRCSTKL